MSDHIAELHRTNLGCSQIAQALGLSKFGTAYELWSIYTGRAKPDDRNDLRLKIGEPMEEVLRPFVAARLGRELRRDRQVHRHPTLPWVGNVDYRAARLPTEKARPVVDMKTSLGFGARHRFGEDGTDQVDDDVMLQMQGYLRLTGAELAYVAALVPGPEIKIYTIEADVELQQMIEDGIAEFWQLVRTDTPPEPHNEMEARQRWSRHTDGRVVDLDEDRSKLLYRYAAMKSEQVALEKEIKAYRDLLIPALQDADTVTYGGTKLATFRANKDSVKIDWKAAFLEATQDIEKPVIEECLKRHTTIEPGARVLRLAKEVLS